MALITGREFLTPCSSCLVSWAKVAFNSVVSLATTLQIWVTEEKKELRSKKPETWARIWSLNSRIFAVNWLNWLRITVRSTPSSLRMKFSTAGGSTLIAEALNWISRIEERFYNVARNDDVNVTLESSVHRRATQSQFLKFDSDILIFCLMYNVAEEAALQS